MRPDVIKLCFNSGCNHTLNDTIGAFQSPGFPGKYPDGQLCSWRIMVPDNHNLVVNFTKFSLYEYDKDSLQLYEYDSRIFQPKQAYFGHQQPFTITATSDLMFVFRSDEENNSTGFKAEYSIFKTHGMLTQYSDNGSNYGCHWSGTVSVCIADHFYLPILHDRKMLTKVLRTFWDKKKMFFFIFSFCSWGLICCCCYCCCCCCCFCCCCCCCCF